MEEIMKAIDERLEEVLKVYGVTLTDLPKEHTVNQCLCAKSTVQSCGNDPYEYICHLADIIDKMEVALLNGSLILNGEECPHGCDGCVDNGTVQKIEDLCRDKEHLVYCLCKMIERYV